MAFVAYDRVKPTYLDTLSHRPDRTVLILSETQLSDKIVTRQLEACDVR